MKAAVINGRSIIERRRRQAVIVSAPALQPELAYTRKCIEALALFPVTTFPVRPYAVGVSVSGPPLLKVRSRTISSPGPTTACGDSKCRRRKQHGRRPPRNRTENHLLVL